MERQITASKIQAQTSAHFPSDTAAAAVVDGQDGSFMVMVKMEPVCQKIIVGQLDSRIQCIGLCFDLRGGRQFQWGTLPGGISSFQRMPDRKIFSSRYVTQFVFYLADLFLLHKKSPFSHLTGGTNFSSKIVYILYNFMTRDK